MWNKLTRLASLGFLYVAVPLNVLADDTDIYLNLDTLQQNDIRPNVLLMLDTSKSMDWGLGGRSDDPEPGESRIEIMRAALRGVLNDTDLHGKINVGLGRFNNTTGSIVYPVVELTAANALTLLDRLDSHMAPAGSTPVVPAYFEGVRYFLGQPVAGGLSRSAIAEGPASIYGLTNHLRISHPDTMSGETWDSNNHRCTARDSDDETCLNEEWDGDPTYDSPVTHQCQPNHLVILTDGEANRNNAQTDIETFLGVQACDDDTNDMECAIDLATHLRSADLLNDQTTFGGDAGGSLETSQSIITHAIAFATIDPDLQAVASAGGGRYYPAHDAGALTDAFTAVLSSVVDTNATFSAPSATVNQFNRLNHLDNIYFAVFHPENTVAWPGNIKRYKLATGQVGGAATPNDGTDDLTVSANTIVDRHNRPAVDPDTGFFNDTSSDFWSTESPTEFSVSEGGAANKMAEADRKVYTYVAGAMTEVNISNAALSAAVLGVDSDDREDLVKWMAGLDVLNWDGDDTTAYRKQMGDPLHSRPVVVTYGRNGSEPSIPDLAMFFGTNDGYFRAIDGQSGAELFSFIPEEMLPRMKTFMANSAGLHMYGVDGSPTVWIKDVDQDGIVESADGDHVYVFFGFRRGGRSYYALDFTDRDNPTFLWRITKQTSGFGEMGQSWSKPIKTRIIYDTDHRPNNYIPAQKDVLIFTAGYDPDQDTIVENDDGTTHVHRRTDSEGRAIYMVDASSGALLWKGDSNNFPAMQYSIPANVAVADTDQSGHADQMYVGDMGGQIWRFDINNHGDWDGNGALPTGFVTGQVIANLSADNSNENARRFYHSPDVAIIKEDNEEKIAVTIGSGYRARPNERRIRDRFYMLKIPSPYGPLSGFTALTESDLLDVTTDATATLNQNHFGWYFKVGAVQNQGANPGNNGEKVLSAPLTVDGKVIFTTYEPTARMVGCSAQPGTSREYVVRLMNGGAAIDRNGDGTLTPDDRSKALRTGTIVDEPVIIFTEDGGGSTFLGTEKGSYEINNNRATRTFWYEKD